MPTYKSKFTGALTHAYYPGLRDNPDFGGDTITDLVGGLDAELHRTDVADLPDLILHLRADVGLTMSGSNVVGWADQSGVGYDLSQSTASSGPTLSTVGDKQWLHFDGQFLTRSGYIGSGGDITVIVAYRVDSETTTPFTDIFAVRDGGPGADGVNRLMLLSHNMAGQSPVASRRSLGGAALAASLPSDTIGIVAGVYSSAANRNTAYVNGAAVGTGSVGSATLTAGGTVTAGQGGAGRIADIAEVAVYDRALTDAEIAAVSDAMQQRWMGESLTERWVTSVGKSAVFLDGVSDRLVIPHDASFNATRGCWSIWVKTDGQWGTDGGSGGVGRGYAALIGRNNGSAVSSGLVVTIGQNQIRLAGLGSDQTQHNAPGLTGDAWIPVAVNWTTVQGESNDIYVAGSLVGSDANITGGGWAGTDMPLMIGDADDFWEEFRGRWDDFCVWSDRLTAAEIAELAQYRGAALRTTRQPWLQRGGFFR